MRRRLLFLLRRRIALKLTVTLVGFVALVEVVAGVYLARTLEERALRVLEGQLVALGRVLHDEARGLLAPGVSAAARQRFALRTAETTGARVTLLLLDGRVVAESERPSTDPARHPSQADRPEVRAALGGEVGQDVRPSVPAGEELLYVALPLADGPRTVGVLRLAQPVSVVAGAYASVRQALLAGGLLALGVALGMGLFIARRLTWPVVEMQSTARRMAEGDFSVRAPVRSPDEIGGLGRALNTMAARLREKIQDLEREQTTTRAILDGMVEGVLAVDAQNHLLLLNRSARAIFRLGPRLREGRPFLEVVRNPDLFDLLQACREAGGEIVSREVSLTTPVERALQVNAVPLRLGGQGMGVLMVLADVTELRMLERVRSEFVANVSHEVRTPLTAVRGYLETLLGGALDEPAHARRFLEIAVRHTERLGRLVDDLLDLSNIELGKVALKLEPLSLAEALGTVLAIVGPRAEARRITLTTDLPPDLPAVRADLDRLVQVLLNLLDNAVKFTPEEGQVRVTAAAEGGMVDIAVTDTGVGIPSTDLPRITERFYRVDKARSRELGGTGLGLAIVKHLVQAHGGRLVVESEVGRGTTVRFTLPPAPEERA
jgi:two-component system phosphate regulon sensor histidine kinase PhoR